MRLQKAQAHEITRKSELNDRPVAIPARLIDGECSGFHDIELAFRFADTEEQLVDHKIPNVTFFAGIDCRVPCNRPLVTRHGLASVRARVRRWSGDFPDIVVSGMGRFPLSRCAARGSGRMYARQQYAYPLTLERVMPCTF